MKSSKLKKLCAVVLAATLATSLFIGCGDNSTSTGSSSGSNQNLVFNLGEDPETMDPTLNNSSGAGTMILNAFEGLMVLDENDQPTEGAAESYEVSDDGLVYTFKLRQDGKWSDGEPVVADNFKYSWLRALDKATAAEYAYQLFYIKNAEKFYNGEVSADEVGIKVIDDYTLEVTLEAPTSYFLQLCAFTTYVPLREDIVSSNPEGWATNPETYVSNGPFKLVQWDMKDQLVFEKNENYWDKDSVKLDTLTFKLVTDDTTAYSELKAGNFDMVNSVPTNEIQPGIAEGLVHVSPKLANYYFAINVGKQDTLNSDVKEVLSNKLVRQALNLAIDRQEIIDNVGKAEQIPAYSFVPQGIKDENGTEFASKEYYDPLDMEGNIAKAKELLKEAGYENGEGIPTIEVMYNSEGAHKEIAQIIQQNWEKIGVNVELTNQEWAVFLNTRQQGDYEIARHGWTGDYIDPMTFLDLWVTGGGNNDTGFSNARYDELIAAAKVEKDSAKRFEMLREAEDILMDEMPILPIYYYTTVTAMNEKVKGVQISTLGKISFKHAYKE
ncbi:peptide ABC transporter substrate-binding protein [Clostridium saudiense]|uniref:Peptide ABC transporter substrate-binding protein n=1 Tax=Clostridium saudiense TaxID=1414720 RepID=A0ABS2FGF7_9CLOT|nr:peptide ABC transporter substrate-binding protein [Clostridium saudiense]MBM6819645.1 peptide ABC transporter substrate-binding protein [Clostridium saudiense]